MNRISWLFSLGFVGAQTTPAGTLAIQGYVTTSEDGSPPFNLQGDIQPCDPDYDEWDTENWPDPSQGFYNSMHYGVYLYNDAPEKACGDIYRMKVDDELNERYIFIMGHQEHDDHGVAAIQIHKELLDPLESPEVRRAFDKEAEGGDYTKAYDELPIDTVTMSGDIDDGLPACDPVVSNPDGLPIAGIIEIGWGEFPGGSFSTLTRKGTMTETSAKCGDTVLVTGVDADGTTGEVTVLITNMASMEETDQFSLALGLASCQDICADDSCPDGGFVSHKCYASLTEIVTTTDDTTPDETIPDDTTTDETIPDDTTTDETIPNDTTTSSAFGAACAAMAAAASLL